MPGGVGLQGPGRRGFVGFRGFCERARLDKPDLTGVLGVAGRLGDVGIGAGPSMAGGPNQTLWCWFGPGFLGLTEIRRGSLRWKVSKKPSMQIDAY